MQMIDVLTKLREIADRSPEEINRAILAAEAMSGRSVKEEMDRVGKEDHDVNNDGKEDETDEYLLARRKAIAKNINKDTKESVSEDVQLTLTGSDAVLAEILKLAGMIGAKTTKGVEPIAATPAPMGMPSTGPVPSLDSMMGGGSETMMDDAFSASTTPNPVTMNASAAVPSGNDLAKPKITTPMTSPGNNPMQTSISFD
jgi:hypothetical protein